MNLSITFEETSRRNLQQALRKAPQKTVGEIRKWVNRTAARTERQVVFEAPVDKGQLKQSTHSKFAINGLEAEVRPTAKHAIWVHEGTGIYGKYKRPIQPKRARVLAWQGSGGMIFARSVKGIKPNPFMDRAYKKVKPEADRDAVKTLDHIVRSI